MVIPPEALSCATTRFASVAPPLMLMFDASGTEPPEGKAVMYVRVLLWLIAVMLRTTACAPAGTGPPEIWIATVPRGLRVLPAHWGVGDFGRVSHTRKGANAE